MKINQTLKNICPFKKAFFALATFFACFLLTVMIAFPVLADYEIGYDMDPNGSDNWGIYTYGETGYNEDPQGIAGTGGSDDWGIYTYGETGYNQPPESVFNPPTCNVTFVEEFGQCGGAVGLGGYPVGHTIVVHKFRNDCTGVESFKVIRDDGNQGVCGVAKPGVSVTSTPSSPVVVTSSQQQASTSFPIPVVVANPVAVAPTPAASLPVASGSQQCPGGTIFAGIQGSNIICVEQQQAQVQNAIAQANAFTGPITVNVPAGATSPQVVETVRVLSAKELPKTGLPFAVWGLTGLAPLGFKLRRFGDFTKTGTGLAQFIWQSREFSR